MYACHPSPQEVEAEAEAGSQPGLHSETLAQKTNFSFTLDISLDAMVMTEYCMDKRQPSQSNMALAFCGRLRFNSILQTQHPRPKKVMFLHIHGVRQAAIATK
jgi:hypothetical protein